jgi:hypothetical protein
MPALAPSAIPRLLRLAGLGLAATVSAVALAQAPLDEESVEAAYLHKFPGFVDWPAEAFKTTSSPIVIGLAGAPKVFDELTRIARGRLVLGRPVEARLVDTDTLPADMQVLFIGKSAAADAARLIDAARRAHMLVVTDMSDGLKAGAVLDFVEIDGRLRFEASLPAAHRADLRLSSKLLSVAAKVVEETP